MQALCHHKFDGFAIIRRQDEMSEIDQAQTRKWELTGGYTRRAKPHTVAIIRGETPI